MWLTISITYTVWRPHVFKTLLSTQQPTECSTSGRHMGAACSTGGDAIGEVKQVLTLYYHKPVEMLRTVTASTSYARSIVMETCCPGYGNYSQGCPRQSSQLHNETVIILILLCY